MIPFPYAEAVTEVLTGRCACGESGKNPENYEEYFEDTLPDAKGTAGSEGSEGQRAPGGKKCFRKGGGPDKEAGRGRRHRKDGKEADIVVKVSPEKLPLVTSAFVDGHRCLVIPWMTTSKPASTEKSGNFKVPALGVPALYIHPVNLHDREVLMPRNILYFFLSSHCSLPHR